MDIAHWLHGLGLQEYEPAFRANKIDAEILPKLTSENLTALGVTVVGDRRKLLAAIAELRARAMPADKARPPASSLRPEQGDPNGRFDPRLSVGS